MVVKKTRKSLSHKKDCESIEFILLINSETSTSCMPLNALTCVNKIVKLLNLCRQVENVILKAMSVQILNSLMNLKESKDSFS